MVPATTNGTGTAKGTDGTEKEGHDWDCNMTEVAVITLPEGHPDGDPVKVNEYVLEGHLGAGSFGNVKKARREVGSPPFQKYAIKMMSRHRLRRFKSSVVAGADGRMVVKTGVDMVRARQCGDGNLWGSLGCVVLPCVILTCTHIHQWHRSTTRLR